MASFGEKRTSNECSRNWIFFSLQTDTDLCHPNPCSNGAPCFNTPGDYYCLCTADWEGKNCTRLRKACNKPPCLRKSSTFFVSLRLSLPLARTQPKKSAHRSVKRAKCWKKPRPIRLIHQSARPLPFPFFGIISPPPLHPTQKCFGRVFDETRCFTRCRLFVRKFPLRPECRKSVQVF